MMNFIYHMLGVAYEIKILSSARIVNQVEDEQTILANEYAAEKKLTEKVVLKIYEPLSDKALLLDDATSKTNI